MNQNKPGQPGKKNLILNIVLVLCVIVIVFCAVKIVQSLIEYKRAEDKYSQIGSEFEDLMIKSGVVTERVDPEQTLHYVQKSGGEIIAKKGATFYAVAASVNKIISALCAAYDSVATVSTMMHGEYGIEDVCISTMTLIGPEGVKGKVPVELTYDEQLKLQASADALKSVIASLEI